MFRFTTQFTSGFVTGVQSQCSSRVSALVPLGSADWIWIKTRIIIICITSRRITNYETDVTVEYLHSCPKNWKFVQIEYNLNVCRDIAYLIFNFLNKISKSYQYVLNCMKINFLWILMNLNIFCEHNTEICA